MGESEGMRKEEKEREGRSDRVRRLDTKIGRLVCKTTGGQVGRQNGRQAGQRERRKCG